jgi:hypothetical protein
MTYVKVNVSKPQKLSPGKGGDKKDRIILVDADDLVSEASRDAKGIVITGNHVFKAGAYAIQMYVTQNSVSGTPRSEGEIDSEGIIQELIFAHPGSSKEIREMRANWLHRNIIAFVEKCSDGSIDQYGASCAPLRMAFEAPDNNEMNRTTFTLTSAVKGPDVAIYEGTLTLAEPAALVDADETSIDLTAGSGEYQLTDNAAATEITTCTNAVDGLVFTLIGSGGSNPATITDANDFILKNGATWTGLAGATITFKAYKSAAAAYSFIELSRS